jgi:hypothetical protein
MLRLERIDWFLADRLVARVAGDAGKGGVHVKDVALHVGDRDRHVGLIDGVLEDLRVDARREPRRFASGRKLELFVRHLDRSPSNTCLV